MDVARTVAGALLEPVTWRLQYLRHEAGSDPAVSLFLLLVLLFCIVRAVRGDRPAALLLVPLSFAWVVFNGPLEGPTLFVLSWSHGITVSDLIAVLGLLVASWRLTPVLVGR